MHKGAPPKDAPTYTSTTTSTSAFQVQAMMSQPAPTSFKVIQVCSVAPLHEPTTPSTILVPTSLPLTFFDLLWLRFPPAECLFFYQFPNLTTTSFFDTILPSLKHSLSITLHHFLPFSGTLTWPLNSPIPLINYAPGDAVSFTVAESTENFNLLCSHLCQATKRHSLTPHLTTSHDQASLLALQVTLFPNYGFCVGITTHHAAFDGKSSIMFFKSWAYICSNLQNPTPTPSLSSPQHLTPFFDRSMIKDPSRIGEVYVEAWTKSTNGPNNRSLKMWESLREIPSDAVKGLFELTPSQIQKLKQHAKSKMKTKVLQLSTFSVTCAYMLTCLVKAEQPKEDHVLFIFSVDCRSRLDPPISATYFGNCVAGQKVMASTKNLAGNDGFISALEGISEALSRVKDDGVLSGAENWVLEMHENVEGRTFSVAGSPLFEVYSTDFGWGRPKKVDMTSTDRTGAFSFTESRDHSGGIEIGLMLSQREMDAFTAHFVQQLESF